MKLEKLDLYTRVADLIALARQNVIRTINQRMVLTYYEIGKMIVEDEQNGEQRAKYGK